jgi:uncharacterized protein with PQ loop repeat
MFHARHNQHDEQNISAQSDAAIHHICPIAIHVWMASGSTSEKISIICYQPLSPKPLGINAVSGIIHGVLFFLKIPLEHSSVPAKMRIMADQTIIHLVHSIRVKTRASQMT